MPHDDAQFEPQKAQLLRLFHNKIARDRAMYLKNYEYSIPSQQNVIGYNKSQEKKGNNPIITNYVFAFDDDYIYGYREILKNEKDKKPKIMPFAVEREGEGKKITVTELKDIANNKAPQVPDEACAKYQASFGDFYGERGDKKGEIEEFRSKVKTSFGQNHHFKRKTGIFSDGTKPKLYDLTVAGTDEDRVGFINIIRKTRDAAKNQAKAKKLLSGYDNKQDSFTIDGTKKSIFVSSDGCIYISDQLSGSYSFKELSRGDYGDSLKHQEIYAKLGIRDPLPSLYQASRVRAEEEPTSPVNHFDKIGAHVAFYANDRGGEISSKITKAIKTDVAGGGEIFNGRTAIMLVEKVREGSVAKKTGVLARGDVILLKNSHSIGKSEEVKDLFIAGADNLQRGGFLEATLHRASMENGQVSYAKVASSNAAIYSGNFFDIKKVVSAANEGEMSGLEFDRKNPVTIDITNADRNRDRGSSRA